MQLGDVGAAQSALPADARQSLPDALVLESHSFFRSVQEGAHLFQGITDTTMSHGEGWHFIQLGRYVERTDTLGGPIGIPLFSHLPHPPDQVVEGADYLEWVGLLKSCAAFEAYCKAYSAELRPLRIAEFLLLNSDFPHSVRFSVESVHAALEQVGDLTERKAPSPVRLAGRLRATLIFSQIEEIMADGIYLYLEKCPPRVRANSLRDSADLFRLFGESAMVG